MSAFTVAFSELAPRDRYKLLCASVTPRPIALVTSLSPDGVVNAAPFSFFNVFSEDPALIVLGLQHKPGNNPKDTTRNIAGAGEFVVNLVDEGLAEAMNICAVDFPPEISEIDAAGLVTQARRLGRRAAYRGGALRARMPQDHVAGVLADARDADRRGRAHPCPRGPRRSRDAARQPGRLQAGRADVRRRLCAPRTTAST